MKCKKMKTICLSLAAVAMMALPLSASAASPAPAATAKANNYTYKPYNSDLHSVYLNGKYQYREGHNWQYSGTMVYCSKCGVYK